MFLINSRRSRFTVAPSSVNRQGHPLSRTYGAILQSSLTTVLPSALVYSTRLPVSVLVRLDTLQPLEAFLGRPSSDYLNINGVRSTTLYSEGGFSNPSNLVAATDISARPLTFRTPSLHRSTHQRRNINLLSIVYAFRPRLRNRLTLGGITFPRKP